MRVEKKKVWKRAADRHTGVVVQKRVQTVQRSLAASYCEVKPPHPTNPVLKPLPFAPSSELGMF